MLAGKNKMSPETVALKHRFVLSCYSDYDGHKYI